MLAGRATLGILIGRALLKRGARLRLLVRPGSRSKVPADLAHAALVAGDSLSFDRLVKEVEAGLGAPITVESLGSFSDLDAEIKNRYAAEPANVPAWLPLMYWRAMLNGSGKLGPLMNDRYPDIRPTGVREYVSRLATEHTPNGEQ